MNKQSLELDIEGMTCDHCATGIEKKFEGKKGILENKVDYSSGKANFVIDANKVSRADIIKTITSGGNYNVINEIESQNRNDTGSIISEKHQFDLIIIGGGSAAFSAAAEASERGKTILMINGRLPIGGTCVNVGCVPSKNLIRAGESVFHASNSTFEGIKPSKPKVDFASIIKQKNELVASLQKKKYKDVAEQITGLTIKDGWATFKDEHTVTVDDSEYTASNFLIATGASTNIPAIKGLEEAGYQTHASLFDIDEKPESLTILGAGYIGLEIAMAYNRLGAEVRILEYSSRVLRSQTPDISDELETHMKAEGIKFYANHRIESISKEGSTKVIKGTDTQTGKPFIFLEPGHVVVATGTNPNTTSLGLQNIAINLDEKGFVKVNDQMQTSLDHIYAAGDCTNSPAFVYTAAKEAKIAASNAFSDEKMKMDYTALPWVVFTDPQVAGTGLDENQARSIGIPFEVSTIPLSEVPRSLAAFDTRGFIKLIRNPETDLLIGARIVAPEGGELIMQASLAIKYKIPVTELAESFHPYLTLSEGIKLAAITFHKDIEQLSCCAT